MMGGMGKRQLARVFRVLGPRANKFAHATPKSLLDPSFHVSKSTSRGRRFNKTLRCQHCLTLSNAHYTLVSFRGGKTFASGLNNADAAA